MNRYRLLSILPFFAIAIHAQIDYKQLVPPSPNVASLFKSVITPVNEYSGLPQVSVSLYTVTEGEIAVPISLSYATGGIQVSEESGNVGLGWAINAGGAITRSVNGQDDFSVSGNLNNFQQLPDIPMPQGYFNPEQNGFITADENCAFPFNGNQVPFPQFDPSSLNAADHMPDLFHFNFNGYSGSFVFNKETGATVLMERQGIRIERASKPAGSANYVFLITTENGIQYEFDRTIETSFPSSNLPAYISSWYLTKIIDTVGNTVVFNYVDHGIVKPLRTYTQTYQVSGDAFQATTPVYSNVLGPTSHIQNFNLAQIQFDSGTIDFNYSDSGERLDVKTYFLKSMEVTNYLGDPISDHDFNYSYFGKPFGNNSNLYNSVSIANGDFAQAIGALSSDLPDINLRLRLDSIVKNDIEVHAFEYFDAPFLPNKTSFSQDYWGFYNNATNYHSFIPELRDAFGIPVQFNQFNKANRLPNAEYAKYFSLNKITYPTGGSTEFDFELNTFDAQGTSNSIPPVTVPKNFTVVAGSGVADTSMTIFPSLNSTLYLKYDLILTGWNTAMSTQKPNINSIDFLNDFYLIFRDRNGAELSRRNIDSSIGTTAWLNYTEEENGSRVPVIIASYEETWQQNHPLYDLADTEYIIEAHFNDHGGLFYGQVSLDAKWADDQLSSSEAYSVGGGLRVKSIEVKDIDGSIQTKHNYNYHYPDTGLDGPITKSYGKIKTLPNYYKSHKAIAIAGFITQAPGYTGPSAYPRIIGSASSFNTLSKDVGSYVGYDKVEITNTGENGDNGKTIKSYYNAPDHFRSYTQIDYLHDFHNYPPVRIPHNGINYAIEDYKRNSDGTYTKVHEVINQYTINGLPADGYSLNDLYQNPNYVISATQEQLFEIFPRQYPCRNFKFQFHPHYSNLIQLTSSSETTYDLNGMNPITVNQVTAYENELHLQPTKTMVSTSDGTVVETKIYYPDDIADANDLPEGGVLESYAAIAKLKHDDQHQIGRAVQTVTKRDNLVLAVKRSEFEVYGQYIDPISGISRDVILPHKTQASKGNLDLESRLLYEEYNKGKPIQLRKEGGPPISYIWGYNNTYPIAKIENASYAAIAAALGVSINILKNYDENDLAQIEALRITNPEFLISTYTYKPLVGMLSTTDHRAYTMSYEYDDLNRLVQVKDANGNLVSDYLYHYKGQNNGQ